jgi:hypothetical protein
MTLGVSVPVAHLNIRNPGARVPQEVDWDAFVAWRGGGVPRFAGRYLIGSRWQWVHGEAGTLLDRPDLGADLRIMPIQRADADRQKATGDDGERYGTEDGFAFNNTLQRCLDVGDLALAKDSVYAFLEVEDGTALSADYWRGWCSALAGGLVFKTKRLASGFELPVLIQPMRPCILCSFGRDAASNKLVAPAAVRQALSTVAAASGLYEDTRCHGFWARSREVAYRVPSPTLDWTSFADYQQPQPKGPVGVPVLLWRYADAPEAAHPVPEIGKLTLDSTRTPAGQPDAVLDASLVAKKWSASARPVSVGVDKGGDLSREIGCLSGTLVSISHLPEGADRPPPQPPLAPGPALTPKLSEPVRFAGRYYSAQRGSTISRRKDLQTGEGRVIALANARVVSIWQAAVPYDTGVYAHLTTPGNGKADARNAFAFAANRARQPAHSPVYFAVDTDVTAAGSPPNLVPSFDQISAYFTEIQDGYRDYLADQVAVDLDPVPYRVGAYSCFTMFDVLYTRGLATHFWQAYPPSWGGAGPRGNGTAWPHANLWQVLMHYAGSPLVASGVLGCRRSGTWAIGIATNATGGTYEIVVGKAPAPVERTVALPFDSDLPQVQTALRALPTWGPRLQDVDTVASPAAGVAKAFTLYYAIDPMEVEIDPTHLVGVGPLWGRNNLGPNDFVDVNVAWGDEGGWQP